MIKNIQIVSMIALVVLLQACGGGGGGDVPNTRPSGKLGGVAHDAPLINAPIKVYAWDNGARGELLGSGTTGPNGEYELSITSPSRPVVVVAGDGGSYVEEASGVSVSLVAGQTMNAITHYESGETITVQVTPFTHLASCYAEYLLGQGERVEDALSLSNSMVSSLVGVEIIRTKPIDVTNPSSANYDLTPGHKYGFLTAGISEAMAYVSAQNGLSAHSQRHLTSIHWANVACNDIRADGLLDGVGYYDSAATGISDLAFGTFDINPDTYRTLVAQKMLAFTRNTRNASTLDVSDLLTFANALSTSTDPVWAGVPGSPVDDTGPTITATLAADSYISGTTDLTFTIDDPVGVAQVRFYVDSVFIDNGDIGNPVFSLNTTTYNDGPHTIKVESDDKIGNTSQAEYIYQIDNSGPSVVLTSAALVGSTSYNATGTWSSPGAAISTITVGGVEADIANDGTWSAPITLSSGLNQITVVAADSLTNTSTQDFSVSVDLVKPVIANQPNTVRYTTYEGQYNLCNIGRIDDPVLPNPVCVRTDRVSLNGLSINGNLSNLEYVLFTVRVEDPSGAGVYTDFDDLTVQYQYLINGTIVKDWSQLETGIRAPQPDTNFGSFYLPIVTEFLGENWYQTSTTDVHEIYIEVSDSVGNKNTISYQINFDVLVPEGGISVTTISDAENVLKKTFNERFSADGQLVSQATKVSNNTGTPLYINFRAYKENGAIHRYQTAIRKNFARQVSTEQWRVALDGSNWMLVDSLIRSGGTTIKPIKTLGNFQEIKTDTLEVPTNTAWSHIASYVCNPGFDYYIPGHYGDDNYAVCYYLKSSLFTIYKYDFDSRIINSAEYEEGYPKNIINEDSVTYSVIEGDILVWDVGKNTPANMQGGWYVLPPKSSIEIKRKYTLPVIFHYVDNEVADLNAFGSYTTKQLDLETSWTIDGRIEVDAVGSIGASSRRMETFTSKNTYTISRS